jgi:hypothetical protein
VITEYQGEYPLPDILVLTRGATRTLEPLYGVRFSAGELWGGEDTARFSVTVDLWESYLESSEEDRIL